MNDVGWLLFDYINKNILKILDLNLSVQADLPCCLPQILLNKIACNVYTIYIIWKFTVVVCLDVGLLGTFSKEDHW